ncbi:hypothetical protein LVJ83_01640 [Uruburuella testudinis]|uniref:Cyanate hydratase N-terminal domain-containing protein n=1 Tax=Uruburuella testudinis TaxID=1282863 RepID=A0ABY4DWY9_9NEIS|nr:hypothetical protein [Uruburuella testudinis]UOO83174.1 hypothetical protein LVJ83_01640 [Uruburuella testudinis]
MKTLPKSIIKTEPLPKNATDEAKIEKWHDTAAKHGLSGEWAVSARLGQQAYTDEQMEAIANLFGR